MRDLAPGSCDWPRCRGEATVTYAALRDEVDLCDRCWTRLSELGSQDRKDAIAKAIVGTLFATRPRPTLEPDEASR